MNVRLAVCPAAVRADAEGTSRAAGGRVGYDYDGVHCFSHEGECIGHIELSKATSIRTFNEPRRKRLLITASQSIYMVFMNTVGANLR